jgi:hypothetical protein
MKAILAELERSIRNALDETGALGTGQLIRDRGGT